MRAAFGRLFFCARPAPHLKVTMTRTPIQRIGDDPARDMIEMVSHLRKLSADMQALTGDVAENSLLTQSTLDKQIELQARQITTDRKLDEMVVKNEEMLTVFNAGKKGVSFFQWIGRTLFSLAKWSMPILGMLGTLWALFHGQSPKGSE